MKKAILWLSVAAIVLYVVGIILVAGGTASSASTGTSTVSGGAAFGSILYILGSLLTFVAWILGIIKTIQVKAWGWLVLVFLISPLGSLIYGIAGPDQAKVAVTAGAYPGQQQ